MECRKTKHKKTLKKMLDYVKKKNYRERICENHKSNDQTFHTKGACF